MENRLPYEAPSMVSIGTLHELTLLTLKKRGGSDGIVLVPNIPLGNAT